ncbi:MAG: proprotein convertase P-domain-containing protein [Saprospiraceae bacterium]|nr:proprotein convertase P-domain-containing protein [Saprospiraceae bacterium]
MKSRLYPGYLMTVGLFWGVFNALLAQTPVAIPHNTGPANITLSPPANCSFLFTDDGGANGVYSSTSQTGSVITFWPSSAGNKIVVQFLSFHTEPDFDALFVYDGPSAASPQISSGAATLLGGGTHPFSSGQGGWQGSQAPYNVAPNMVRATATNSSGALSFAFDADQSIEKSGWTAVVSEIPGTACSLQAPGAQTVAAQAGNCYANVQTVPPAILPGACAQVLELRYRINDGPAVTVSSPAPPAILLSGLPVGLNVLSWQLVEPCGGGLVATAAQFITVTDPTPPTIIVPANVSLNLGAGLCTAKYNYQVSAVDDCVFSPDSRVDHPVDFNNGTAGLMFDVKNLSTEAIRITEFGPVLDAGTWPLEVYITTAANSWQGVADNPAAWLLAGSRTVVSAGAQSGTPLTGFALELAPGESRGIYLTSTLGAPLRCTGIGAGTQRQFDDGILQVSSAPGASKGFPFGATTLARAYNGYVKCAPSRSVPEQIAGLPPGADFPVGTTVNVFRCTDAAGNTSTASFSVVVQAFSGATNSLVCAGTVNTSLGPDCEKNLRADDILFGGPYRCYDSYLVQLDKIPPYNNGPWVPAYLNHSDIGKTYGVRVTDPLNNNFCLSNVLVEDKLPPTLTGAVVELPCNFNTEPTLTAPASVVRVFTPAQSLPLQVSDFQSLELSIPATASADAVVEDVDLEIRVNGDVFEKNLQIELESPAGVKLLLWNQATGCSGSLWVRFDDEGDGSADCTQFTANRRSKIPFGGALLSAFDGSAPAGTWKLRLRDLNGFGDVATLTEARLIVRYKAAFSAGFPNGLTFPGQLTQVTPTSFVAAAPLIDGCTEVTLNYSDETTSKPCSTGLSAIIERTWTARDVAGNTSSLVQTIRLLRPSLEEVVLPPNYNDQDAPAFDCGGPYPTPAWIESQGLAGTPHVFGQSNGCSVNWSYMDIVVDVCPGSYTINRNWSIVDACSGQSRQAMQLIQVLDQKKPALTCPANLTVSTNLYTCCTNVNLPDIVVEDACSAMANLNASVVVFEQYFGDTLQINKVGGSLTTFPGNNTADLDTLAAFGTTACLPIGTHHVYYKVEDACGNAQTCSYQLTILDYTPPVAVGQSLTIVGLNADDPEDCYEAQPGGVHFAGVSVVPASAFDQGSYDNCNFIRLTVRRKAPYSPFIQSLNAQNGHAPCQDAFPDVKSEFARATAESDSIKFYCGEAGSTQTLVLRCYQLDALGEYSKGPDGAPLFNETVVQVEVQDKLKPGCQPPANLTVSCENFDPTLSIYGAPGLQDNCCLDSTKTYLNQSGLSHTPDYTQFDTVCNRGTLVRTFTVYDCQGQTSQCAQKIVVNHNHNFAIKFPDDVLVSVCDSSGLYGKPEFYGQGCASLAVSFHDETLTVVPDACYLIERTWRITNWCDYLPSAACISVPNPTPNAVSNHPDNLSGPIVSPAGFLAPWTATKSKLTPVDPQATDFSSFWNPTVNCYEYKQVIKVSDVQEPKVENCSDTTLQVKDQSPNAVTYWNESYWKDGLTGTHNLGEGAVDLSVSGFDLCSGTDLQIRYLLFLDLDGEGPMETVISSTNLPGANTVMYNNAANPNFGGGTARAFDERPVPANQKYGFALKTSVTGKLMTASVRWNTAQDPDTYVLPELPYGNHKVKWVVSDGCGNESVCEYAFKIQDAKAPTVVCHNGLSVNIMPTMGILMWANDFLKYAEDNFTPSDQLIIGVRRVGAGTGFPYNPNGTPQTSVLFTCDDLGPQAVEIWALDKEGNADYCETYVLVQDNNLICQNGSNQAMVAGQLATEDGGGLQEAQIDLSSTPVSVPPLAQTVFTDIDGQYLLSGLPLTGNYTITPLKDNDPLNGVSTFDLVLINKHILGLEPLDSPFKMIAADANGSRSITTLDILEFRKLILGIYTDYPAKTSWRFIDKTYQFPNPANPFQEIFPETIELPNLQTSQVDQDFVAVKTGDVNGNAVTNNLVTTDDRSAAELYFDVQPVLPAPKGEGEQLLQAGETIRVRFTSAEPVVGYQFTLGFPDLELVDIQPGAGMSMSHFAVFEPEHALTTSFDAGGLEPRTGSFDLTFRVLRGGMLSQLLTVSSRITKAEAYKMNVANSGNETHVANEKMNVALRFNGQNGPVVAAQGFELYQNQPNPWLMRTQIGFYLPEASAATLTIYDETGRTVFVQKGEYSKGHNAITLDKSLLNTSGVLQYKLETPTHSAVKQMIQTR